MKTALAIVVLLAGPAYFAIKTYSDYECIICKIAGWTTSSTLASILLVIYSTVIVIFGANEIYNYSSIGSEFRKFSDFFVFPAIGFTLAIFPKPVAEYSNFHVNLKMLNIEEVFIVPGWILIMYLFIIFIIT